MDYSDNPYLYDTKGPKKQTNYAQMETDDMVNTVDESGGAAEFEGDSYRITHKNERFALVPGDIKTNTI